MMKKFKVIIPCIVYKTYEVEAPSAYCDDGVAEVEEIK